MGTLEKEGDNFDCDLAKYHFQREWQQLIDALALETVLNYGNIFVCIKHAKMVGEW